VHECTIFLSEYHTTSEHDRSVDSLQTTDTQELQVWDHPVFIFLRESSMFQCLADSTRTSGYFPRSMQMGSVAAATRWWKDRRGLQ
jgi:hypothetical protein